MEERKASVPSIVCNEIRIEQRPQRPHQKQQPARSMGPLLPNTYFIPPPNPPHRPTFTNLTKTPAPHLLYLSVHAWPHTLPQFTTNDMPQLHSIPQKCIPNKEVCQSLNLAEMMFHAVRHFFSLPSAAHALLGYASQGQAEAGQKAEIRTEVMYRFRDLCEKGRQPRVGIEYEFSSYVGTLEDCIRILAR